MGMMINRRRVCGGKSIDRNVLLYLKKDLIDCSSYNRTTTYAGDIQQNYNNDCIYIHSYGSIYSALFIDQNITSVIGSKDYSISLDVNVLSFTGSRTYSIILSNGGSNTQGGLIGMNESGFYWYATGMRIQDSNISHTKFNTWYHIEFIKKNGIFYLKCDGEVIGTSNYGINMIKHDTVIGRNQSSVMENSNICIKNLIIRLL